MNVIITGANYNNKGAQSMLFITAYEIRKRFPDSDIFYASGEELSEFKNLRFNIIYYNNDSHLVARARFGKNYLIIKNLIKNSVKYLLKRKNIVPVSRTLEFDRLLKKADLILDISGFVFGDRFSYEGNERALDMIRIASKYGIPIMLLPQSFGPFNFNGMSIEKRKHLLEDLKKWLTYPEVIFAREKQGFNSLCNGLGLNNVKYSRDLVLQNEIIHSDDVYIKQIELNIPNVNSEKNVAVIPNNECFVRGNYQLLMELYVVIIDDLLISNREVYIIKHSNDDINVCNDIKSKFSENKHVHLLCDEFSCFEYDGVIGKFEFAICSRFHGVVHAYKRLVPCLILGWADKYIELAECVEQSDYVFDVVSQKLEFGNILSSLYRMRDNIEEEKSTIEKRLQIIRENNCFDEVAAIYEAVKNRYEDK